MEKSPQETNQVPQPVEDGMGATDPGPRNVLLNRQNPGMLTPPRVVSKRARPGFVVTHHIGFDDVVDAYQKIDRREPGYIKVVLRPNL